jgi:hypothetical protein
LQLVKGAPQAALREAATATLKVLEMK